LDVEDAAESVESADEITEIKTDDDFLLTAMDDAASDESSDSGSQVIALDSDDEISSGMFAPIGGGAGLLEEEPGAAPSLSDSSVLVAAPMLAPAPGMIAAAAPAEAPFSTANVSFLIACALLLMFCGMMTFDLVRNMWSWDGPYTVNSSVMDSLGNTVGWFEK